MKNCFIISVIIIINLSSCDQNKQHQTIMKMATSSVNEVAKQALECDKKQDSYDLDTTAVANIHLNTTQEVFEQEKQQFLLENQSLGKLKIKSVTGFYYNDRLAAVEIISYPQSAHKGGMLGFYGWEYLYHQKYGNIYGVNGGKFQYIKGCKGIIVSDLCASDKPFSSFQDLMNQPLKLCYRDETLFPARSEMANINDISLLFEISEVLNVLPKTRAKQYQREIDDELGKKRNRNNPYDTPIFTYHRIYDTARREANIIIEQRNGINSKKHKNDPSWSVVIICFMPAVDNYNREQRELINKQQNERNNKIQKDLEKI